MSVLAVADMYGIGGRRRELIDLLAGARRAAAAESGCVRYDFAEAIGEPDHFVLVSEWQDSPSFDAHYRSSTFASFQFALNGLLARPSEMTVYTVSATGRPVASGPMDPREAD
jgi:quinol monooxygenase YgiN